VAGTGGALVTPFGTVRAEQRGAQQRHFGVLNLTLATELQLHSYRSPERRSRTTGRPRVTAHGPTVSGAPTSRRIRATRSPFPQASAIPIPAMARGDTQLGTTSTSSTGRARRARPHRISAAHVVHRRGRLRVPVTVTNSGGYLRKDTVSRHLVAPPVLVGAGDIADLHEEPGFAHREPDGHDPRACRGRDKPTG